MNNWSCELCGKCFKRQSSVKQHKSATKGGCASDDVKALNQTLRHFHDDKANLCVGARRKSKRVVEYILSDILVNRLNKNRFDTEAVLEGSYKTGLKIGKPDEFDFSVGLRLPPSYHVTGSHPVDFEYVDEDIDYGRSVIKRPLIEERDIGNIDNLDERFAPVGYRVIQLKRTKSKQFRHATVGDLLVPYEVLVQFHKFVTVAVDNLGDRGITVGRYARGPALSLNIRDPDIVHTISVDLTPVVYMGEAEPVLRNHGWPRTGTLDWLSEEKIDCVKNTGIYLVPKGDKFWKVSFARCEDEILRDIDGKGVNGTRKTCLRICKMKLKQWKSKSENGMKAISSYMLKTTMLWLCELFPDDDDWHETHLAARYCNFLRILKSSLAACYLEEYFVPTINLLEDKDQADIEEMLGFLDGEIESMGPATVKDDMHYIDIYPFTLTLL